MAKISDLSHKKDFIMIKCITKSCNFYNDMVHKDIAESFRWKCFKCRNKESRDKLKSNLIEKISSLSKECGSPWNENQLRERAEKLIRDLGF